MFNFTKLKMPDDADVDSDYFVTTAHYYTVKTVWFSLAIISIALVYISSKYTADLCLYLYKQMFCTPVAQRIAKSKSSYGYVQFDGIINPTFYHGDLVVNADDFEGEGQVLKIRSPFHTRTKTRTGKALFVLSLAFVSVNCFSFIIIPSLFKVEPLFSVGVNTFILAYVGKNYLLSFLTSLLLKYDQKLSTGMVIEYCKQPCLVVDIGWLYLELIDLEFKNGLYTIPSQYIRERVVLLCNVYPELPIVIRKRYNEGSSTRDNCQNNFHYPDSYTRPPTWVGAQSRFETCVDREERPSIRLTEDPLLIL